METCPNTKVTGSMETLKALVSSPLPTSQDMKGTGIKVNIMVRALIVQPAGPSMRALGIWASTTA